jgi:hypothetical protein
VPRGIRPFFRRKGLDLDLATGPEGIQRLEIVDCLFFLYLIAILVLLALFGSNIQGSLRHTITHMGFLGVGVLLLLFNSARPRRWVFFWRVWYIPFLYFFLFEEVGEMIHLIQPAFFDSWVLDLEARVFGGYPTVWLQTVSSSWLTESMSVFYMTYYFLIPVLGLTLYRRRRWKELRDFILATSMTFFFCFLHYLLTPVAGPIFFTEGIPFDLTILRAGPATAFEQWLFFKGAIQGGAFPSSHVAVAVVVLLSAISNRIYPYGFTVTVMGLSVSTVYNSYHYGIDVIYGVAIGILFSYLAPFLNRAWTRRAAVRWVKDGGCVGGTTGVVGRPGPNSGRGSG